MPMLRDNRCTRCGSEEAEMSIHEDGARTFSWTWTCSNCGQVEKWTWQRGKWDGTPAGTTDGQPPTVEVLDSPAWTPAT